MRQSDPAEFHQYLNTPDQYDYIIAGGGCAGLSLVMHMIGSGQFEERKVLIIDKDQKNSNDRTWCFWEKEPGLFEAVVYRQWKQLSFFSHSFQKIFDTDPYTYKMIRGIDFYKHCYEEIRKHLNIKILYGEINSVFSIVGQTGLKLQTGETFYGRKIFSSILPKPPELKNNTWLLQHFKGWVIKLKENVFDPASATIMDFRVGQEHGTSFCYVLPFSENEALVEFTVFSANILESSLYDIKLKEYLANTLGINNYEVKGEEFGVIPMTDYNFPLKDKNIIYIGTAGGQTKGSTGYTFKFIQKHSKSLVNELLTETKNSYVKKRHRFYDSVLLGVLEHKLVPGEEVFTRMFRRNKPSGIFRFLDNESSLAEEIGIIRTLPTLPFLKAAIRKIF
jgi:lycopene beta-cyclase